MIASFVAAAAATLRGRVRRCKDRGLAPMMRFESRERENLLGNSLTKGVGPRRAEFHYAMCVKLPRCSVCKCLRHCIRVAAPIFCEPLGGTVCCEKNITKFMFFVART